MITNILHVYFNKNVIGIDLRKCEKSKANSQKNHINLIALSLAVIALRCYSVITFAGAPSTIAYIFDFPWNISMSFFARRELNCLKVIK